MEEPAHKQTHPADTAADRSYLLKLLQPIKEAYETQTALTFRIAGARAKGFFSKGGWALRICTLQPLRLGI